MEHPGEMEWEAVRILMLGSEAKEDVTLGTNLAGHTKWKQQEWEVRKRVEIWCALAVEDKGESEKV